MFFVSFAGVFFDLCDCVEFLAVFFFSWDDRDSTIIVGGNGATNRLLILLVDVNLSSLDSFIFDWGFDFDLAFSSGLLIFSLP